MNDGLYRRFLSAAGYALTCAVLARGTIFATSFMMARILLPRAYGIYSLVVSFLFAMSPIAGLRLDIGLMKFIPELRLNSRQPVGSVVGSVYVLLSGSAALVSLIVALLAGPVATVFYRRPEVAQALVLTAPVLIVVASYQAGVGTLMGLQEFRLIAIVQGATALLQIVLMVPGAWFWGLRGTLAGYGASWTFGAIFALAVAVKSLARNGIVLRARTDTFAELAKVFRFSGAYLIGTLSWPFALWCGNALLARFRGLESSAEFTVAFSFSALTLFLPGYFTNPSLPFLSEAYAGRRLAEFRTLMARNSRLIWLWAVPLAIFITASSKLLLRVLYGEKFVHTWQAATLLSLAAVFAGSVGILSQGFASIGRVWQVAALSWVWILGFAALAWILVPTWGATGASAAYLAATVVIFAAYQAYARHALRLKDTGAGAGLAVLAPAYGLAFLVARNNLGLVTASLGALLALGPALLLWRFLLSSSERTLAFEWFRTTGGRLRMLWAREGA